MLAEQHMEVQYAKMAFVTPWKTCAFDRKLIAYLISSLFSMFGGNRNLCLLCLHLEWWKFLVRKMNFCFPSFVSVEISRISKVLDPWWKTMWLASELCVLQFASRKTPAHHIAGYSPCATPNSNFKITVRHTSNCLQMIVCYLTSSPPLTPF